MFPIKLYCMAFWFVSVFVCSRGGLVMAAAMVAERGGRGGVGAGICLHSLLLTKTNKNKKSHVVCFLRPPPKKKQDRAENPVLYFEGDADPNNENAFLRTVSITMNCSTPSATLYYTTDGFSVPGTGSPSLAPGGQLQWSEEGLTTFRVVAIAEGFYKSGLVEKGVTVVAPRTDQHALAEGVAPFLSFFGGLGKGCAHFIIMGDGGGGNPWHLWSV